MNKLTQKIIVITVFLNPNMIFAATKISINQALAGCKNAGITMTGTPVQSELKKQTSLIGMAYLNYIYQNDITNPHFCQSMLLMNSQVPAGTNNLYVHLFDAERASKTMPILQDIQMSFDYSIARTNPPIEKVQTSVNTILETLK